MIKQNLIIYEFNELFNILNEIKKNLNFNLINVSKRDFFELKLHDLSSFLIITKNKNLTFDNQIVFKNYPMRISKLLWTCLNKIPKF